MTRFLLAALIIASLGLTSCGVRGPLEAPPGAPPPSDEPTVLDPLI
ncbi:MAG: lipoprotein [Hyphomicrobiales bacterium]